MIKQLATAAALIATTATAGMAKGPLASMSFPMDKGCQGQLIVDSVDSDGDVNLVFIEDCGYRYERHEAWVRCDTTWRTKQAWIAEKGTNNWVDIGPNSEDHHIAEFACNPWFF